MKNYFKNFYNCITMAVMIFLVAPFRALQNITKILVIVMLNYVVVGLYLINAIANSKKIEAMIIEIFNFIIFTFKDES